MADRLARLILSAFCLILIVSCVTPVPEPEPVVETPAPEPEPADEPEIVESSVPIEVPDDVYNRAFQEVSEVIDELNEIISRGDFDAWQNYLTAGYVAYFSDSDVLEELSAQPRLVQESVTLRTIRDYFQNVVRPSRVGFRLDSLLFYSDKLVEAVTVFRGQSVILYLLRNVDGQWRVDTFDEPPGQAEGQAQ